MSILILSVSVIKSDPTGKTGIAWFTTVPLNSLSDQVHILYQCFCFLQLFIFICGFSAKVVLLRFLLIRNHEESHRYDTFRVRKKIVSFTFFIRVRFQRCKSEIDIFAWKVTYNYLKKAYSEIVLFIIVNKETALEKNHTANNIKPELGTFKWWISGLSTLFLNLQIK